MRGRSITRRSSVVGYGGDGGPMGSLDPDARAYMDRALTAARDGGARRSTS
jgi:hypothetical protein